MAVLTEEQVATLDQRVTMRNMPWSHFEVMLALRGDAPTPRMTYLQGDLELMSPSQGHEFTKTNIGRLVETYADAVGVNLWGYGSWTLKNAPKERGAEPDECYCLGAPPGEREFPDLAIEVVWTSGGLDKLKVYAGLGVGELWFWESGRISVHLLRGDHYEPSVKSVLFPVLDLALLAKLAAYPNPSQAVRELRAWVRESAP
jgi:Uma2 family endonuclease